MLQSSPIQSESHVQQGSTNPMIKEIVQTTSPHFICCLTFDSSYELYLLSCAGGRSWQTASKPKGKINNKWKHSQLPNLFFFLFFLEWIIPTRKISPCVSCISCVVSIFSNRKFSLMELESTNWRRRTWNHLLFLIGVLLIGS